MAGSEPADPGSNPGGAIPLESGSLGLGIRLTDTSGNPIELQSLSQDKLKNNKFSD